MKIEKGKLYYDADSGTIFKADMTTEGYPDGASDKISVHCPTEKDWNYVVRKYNFHGGFNKKDVVFYLDNSGWDYCNIRNNGYHIMSIDQFKEFYPPISKEEQKELIVELSNSEPYPDSVISNKTDENVQNTQPHYDNTHGSLYKIAEQRKWNSYQFDIVKRIDRALKKGQFKEDLQKTKDLIDLWLREESN